MSLRPVWRFPAALAVGLIGGWGFARLGTPLPWLLGALFPCAVLNLAGARLFAPQHARRAGQWAVGTALGLYFTPELIGRMGELAVFVSLASVYAVALGLAFAWSLSRFARADPPTAFYGGAVGGASEMAVQGERAGGSVVLITAGHTLRVMMVVSIVPFLFYGLGVHGDDAYVQPVSRIDYSGLAVLAVVSGAAGVLALRLQVPNAFVMGPLFATAALGVSGVALSALPQWIVNGAQMLIGISLGTRFAPGFFETAPRYLAVIGLTTLAGIGVSALFGGLLAVWAGLPIPTLILATSPGGIAEMSLTAKALQLGVPIVTIFHVVRYVFTMVIIASLYRAIGRRRGWPMPGVNVL